jgi:protein-serine/threonine kinase
MNNQQQQANQQPPAPNRLQLNFGFNNERNNPAVNDPRQFPTTPSTFPQPVYPNQNGQQEVLGTAPQQQYPPTNYFVHPYQQQQYQQPGNMAPNPPYRSPPPPGNQVPVGAQAFQNDPANGLAQQFAHQNLGGSTPRSASPYARHPSPGNGQHNGQQRPRTAGATGGQAHAQYGTHLSPQLPMATPQPSLNDDEPPPKNPDRYGDNVLKKAKVSSGLVGTFFKDNVQRARDRNLR